MMTTKLYEGARVRIKPLDYLKPCLRGKEGTLDEVIHMRPSKLYHVKLDAPDPISGATVEAGELEPIEIRPEVTLSNYRVEYVAPNFDAGHTFEPRCSILADAAEFDGKTVRVFDVPDPDESQRAVAQFACDAMNQRTDLITALSDCVESLKRLPNVDGAFRVSCITQAERILRTVKESESCTK